MKTLTSVLVLIFFSVSISQIKSFESDYVEMLKKDIQENSRQIVADNLTLTEEQAKIFWPLYDEYDAAYDKMVDERVDLIKKFMMNYYGMDEETGKALITKTMDLKQKGIDVQKEYINKMMEVLPISVVGKFFQLDNRITAIIDIARMANLPLLREEEQ